MLPTVEVAWAGVALSHVVADWNAWARWERNQVQFIGRGMGDPCARRSQLSIWLI